ncbi:MAG: O-acetyl-ADP-ribose deacetylase [Candidatus Nanoarchaeia archaeon]
MKLEIIQGDITQLKVDAIVNAANMSLLGGAGVDGAIHRAAGNGLYEECEKLTEIGPGIRLRTGEAIITKGYNLLAKHVIHTVGPVYSKVKNPRQLLTNAYFNSLKVAEENNLESIAFPAISTGVYGYPMKEALEVTKNVLDDFRYKSIKKVILCYFSAKDKKQAEKYFDSK